MKRADSARLLSGFRDPVFGSQSAFRTLLSCVAYPGRIFTLNPPVPAPGPLNTATTAACLCLVDFDTPLWLDSEARCDAVRAHVQFHCGAPLTEDPHRAKFCVIANAAKLSDLSVFHAGDVEYPDRSATLIVQVASLAVGTETTWSGPGIQTTATARIDSLTAAFWSSWQLNRELYPLGLDIFFTCGQQVMALPRSIAVQM